MGLSKYIVNNPPHHHWLSYLQLFLASLSSPLQWEEIFIHLFFFYADLTWLHQGRYREKRPQDGSLRTLPQISLSHLTEII